MRRPPARGPHPGHTPRPVPRADHPMPTREGALSRAAGFFDNGQYQALLTRLVAIPSTSQDPGHEAALEAYLGDAIRPWAESLGFTAAIHPNPVAGFGPILTAERIE